MLNPYFLNGSKNEQNLVQNLVNEQLKMYGVEVYYLPRQYATEKKIIKEVIESKFEHAYPLEAYVDSYEGFGGQGTILSKFGIQEKDDLTLVISRERFSDYISPFMKDIPNMKGVTHRPREGDLIWFPLGDKLFEIKYVEHEQPFYQLEKNYVYQLKCELYRYEDEVIDTGIEDVDDEVTEISTGFTKTLVLVGVAETALATATLCSGGSVNSISITDMGNNYNIAPIVAFSSAPSGGETATGIATITTEYIGCDGSKSGKIFDIYLTNTGCGYTIPPKITFETPKGYTGSGAAATTGISTTGSVKLVTVTNGGGGYIGNVESVGISTPKHVGAAATAVLALPSQAGAGVSVISAPISIGSSDYLFPYGTTGGVFYKTAPTVTFANPTGTGDGALATATIDDPGLYGGTVNNLAITTEGKFYTSAPTVSITHPGVSIASASIGIAGTSLDPSTIAFSTTGRAYTSAPTVLVSTGVGTHVPYQTAVGIATIHPITGIVTAVSFDVSDPWAVGSGATIGIGYTVTPNLSFSSPSPVQATATATVSVAGTVTSLSIGSSGFGYQSVPTVTISAPTGVTTQFTTTGIATIRFDSISTTGTIGIGSTVITGINTTNMVVGDRVRLGTGYSSVYPEVQTFPDPTHITGIGVSTLFISKTTTNVGIATTTIEVGIQNCGIVTGISITYGGGGYLSPPTVTITNDTGEKNYVDEVVGVHTSIATGGISLSGTLTDVYLTSGGSGYILTPEVTIDGGDNSNSGSGTFIFNETVTGSTSGVTGRVKIWNSETNTLELSNVTGDFTLGERIVGGESGASYVVRVEYEDDIVDTYADNDNFELEGDKIIDFSSTNPFGMP